jgi:thiamine kinase-like enzyme
MISTTRTGGSASPGERIGPRLDDLGPEVAAEVRRLLGGGRRDGVALSIELEKLHHSRVFRARLAGAGEGPARSVVIKRVKPRAAERNRLIARRWLPWLGLDGVAPSLLGTAGGPARKSIWQIYEDVRGATLRVHQAEPGHVAAAVDLIAEIHTRAGGHPVVSECRREGEDFGSNYFTSNVRDALSLLEALRPPTVRPSAEQAALRDRLRQRLERLLGDAPERAAAIAQDGGPDTLLHGDLGASNIVLAPAAEGTRVRIVDWDHAGAGPVAYDLSFFLSRFAAAERGWILERYRSAVARAGWRLPAPSTLDLLFETAECARCANRIIWPAIALLHDGAAWGFGELAEIEQWFEALQPVIQGQEEHPSWRR